MNFCISFVWPDPLHCLLSFSTSQFFCCSGVCLSWKFSESEGRHRKLNAGENSFNSDNVSVPLHISYFFHFVCSLQRYRWWRVNFQWNFTFVRRLTLNFICLVLWSTTNIGQDMTYSILDFCHIPIYAARLNQPFMRQCQARNTQTRHIHARIPHASYEYAGYTWNRFDTENSPWSSRWRWVQMRMKVDNCIREHRIYAKVSIRNTKWNSCDCCHCVVCM